MRVTDFTDFLGQEILGVEIQVYIFVLVASIGWVRLNRTPCGRRTIAVGRWLLLGRLRNINYKARPTESSEHTLLLTAWFIV